MKKLLILLFMLGVTTANAQYYYIMYVSVEAEHAQEFERKEMTYWSKVAKSNIDKGKQNLWGLFRKVGTAGNNEVNYAFVNGFPSLADMTNQDWDPSVLGGIDPTDASSPYTVYEVHNYKILESIPGEASKYSVWNYGRPKNLNGFISENRNLWMPQHKKNIKNGSTGMTNWGMGYKLYPAGQNETTVMTWDGYDKLEDAYKAFDGSTWTPPKNSKMSEYDPDGFRLRVIWERLMSVN